MKKEKAMRKISKIFKKFNNKEFAEILDGTIGFAELENIIFELRKINKYSRMEGKFEQVKDARKRLRELRFLLDISQKIFSRALGFARTVIGNCESRDKVSLLVQQKIIKVCEIREDYFNMPDYKEYLVSITDKLAVKGIELKKLVNANKVIQQNKKGAKNE